MSTDVFEDWKNRRFIAVEASIIDISDDMLVILTDVEYWNDNYDALQEWCKDYEAEVRGMTVTLSEQALTAFCLRW
jgi:F0F1-type ATP synthase epsilon subunit